MNAAEYSRWRWYRRRMRKQVIATLVLLALAGCAPGYLPRRAPAAMFWREPSQLVMRVEAREFQVSGLWIEDFSEAMVAVPEARAVARAAVRHQHTGALLLLGHLVCTAGAATVGLIMINDAAGDHPGEVDTTGLTVMAGGTLLCTAALGIPAIGMAMSSQRELYDAVNMYNDARLGGLP
jgi:hypothetical protein